MHKYLSFCTVPAICAVLAISTACKQTPTQAAAPLRPGVPVVVASAATESVPIEVMVVGSVEASETVQIKSQVAGQIEKVHFREGQMVEKGDLLFTIDERPFRQALLQLEAAVARDRAALRQSEATLNRDMAQSNYAASEVKRYSEAVSGGLISRTQFEQLRTNSEVGLATVQASRAAIESAQANLASNLAAVERAKIEIAYCSIRSPISGRTGAVLLHAGNLVKVSDTPLVVVNRTSPIYVTFNVPERHLASIRTLSARSKLPVRATLKDNPGLKANGFVTLIDNSVDPGTGSIRLKGSFANEDGLLWPGQFTDVVLGLGRMEAATVIPAESVQPGQQGPFVYKVKPDQTVELQPVTVGDVYQGKVPVLSGVRPGDVVVTDGQLRLAPGAKVKTGADPARTAGV